MDGWDIPSLSADPMGNEHDSLNTVLNTGLRSEVGLIQETGLSTC